MTVKQMIGNRGQLLSWQVAKCTQAVYSTDKKLIKMCVMALMVCEEHGGVHHFAVINEGKAVCMTEAGIKCLRDQGIKID